MKRTLILVLAAVSLSSAAAGDVLVRIRLHVNSFYHEGVQRPERTDMIGLWIAPKRAACLSGSFKIIIDADHDLLILVNEAARTYAQAALSRPVTGSMTPDDREAMPSHEMRAKVLPTGETRTILGRTCRGYSVDLRSTLDHKAMAWISADVPIDLEAYRALRSKFYGWLGRYDAASATALLGIPGFVLSRVNVADLKGETVRVDLDVIEMTVQPPPPGLFAVPEGYTKKPGLTHADIDLIASILE